MSTQQTNDNLETSIDTQEKALEQVTDHLLDHDYRLPWHRPFLEQLAQTGNLAAACRAVGKNYDYVRKESRRNDAVFAEAWRAAESIADDRLELTLLRRATVGERRRTVRTRVRRERNAEGVMVIVEEETVEVVSQHVSDGLLLSLMKARRPERFRERFDHRVRVDDELPDEHDVYRHTPASRWAELAAIAVELELPVVDGRAKLLATVNDEEEGDGGTDRSE